MIMVIAITVVAQIVLNKYISTGMLLCQEYTGSINGYNESQGLWTQP
jgi:hypothetical protein